jgi:hypothetical protein
MRRLVVGVAAGLLLCPLAIASSSTACAETKIRERTVSRLVARSPLWWSVGLIMIPLERMTPGTRWFVIVRSADGRLRQALAVSGNTVLIPAPVHARDDVDGCDPRSSTSTN